MVLPPGGSGRVGYRRPNNFTQNTRCKHTLTAGVVLCAAYAPRNHPVNIRIADNNARTNYGGAPTKTRFRATVRIADNRGDTTRRGATCQLGGRIGRGASTRSHDDAYCGAKVEYRTSSTPAYTDELDLHYSTNNAPTKT